MFSQKTFDFLFQNRMNNSKAWFLEHKGEYESYVLTPLAQLAMDLSQSVLAVDDKIITEPKVNKTISRIYRDTRFSKDKSLYREEMWLSFHRDKKCFPQYPEFFFVIMPGEFIYGCGYYAAASEAMESIRKLILKGDSIFKKAQKAFSSHPEFFMDGEVYKRSKYPEQPEELRAWLDRKNISFMCKSNDISQLFTEDLSQKIAGVYRAMEPIYKFFIHAEISSRMSE